MKKLLLLIVTGLLSTAAFSQTYQNSWINYSQEYYKIKVWQDGIYRITQPSMLLAGFSLSGLSPGKFQIYHNGQEQYIYVEDHGDGSLDTNDFIEFYGMHNDGQFDSSLYEVTAWHPAPNYSLFTDTSVYFLTYSPLTNGKRLTPASDTNFGAYTAAPYFIRDSTYDGKSVVNSGSLFGYNRGYDDQSIEYTESEGWGAVFGYYFGSVNPCVLHVATDKVFSGGPNAEISFAVGGVNNNPHSVVVTFPGVTLSDSYWSQTLHKYNFSLSPGLLTTPLTDCSFGAVVPSGGQIEYSLMYWMHLRYPHTYDLEGLTRYRMLVPDGAGKAYMHMTNFNGSGIAPVMYDLTNHRRVEVAISGSTCDALVDNDGSVEPKECFLTSQSEIQSVSIAKINYIPTNPGHFHDIDAMGVDSAFIIVTHKLLWSQATAYNDYRNQHAPYVGRSVMFDVNELYDQFAYGIQKHPLSIKNFSHFVRDNWPSEPQNIFLLGKSRSPVDFRLSSVNFDSCLVASYGVPTSDVLLTSYVDTSISGAQWEPKIPIGRLSARYGADVQNYLNKVMEYEDAQRLPPQPWMKEILHFGGGNNVMQQAELAGYLSQYENILEDSSFGGNVTTYLKFSNAPIQENRSDSLQRKINNGVALMTFFGHASGSGFDISTDEPANYGNQGKYPVVVANSCFAGDFHADQKSVSEKFVMEPNKAAIGFLASVGLGNPLYLVEYTTAFFNRASRLDYGASIGQLMKKAIQDIQTTNGAGERQVAQEMSFQGDPAIRFNSFTKPDFEIDESHITVTPSTITTDLDTFSVDILTRNIGKATGDTFTVKVTHRYPSGVDSVYTFHRTNCFYSDDLRVLLHTGGFSGAGVNKLKVEIDLPDSVDEYDNYSNNIDSIDFFIISKDIIPVYPPQYAIHPYNTVTLKASTANPLAGMASYTFQIDTIDLNLKDATPGAQTSPMFRFSNVQDSGGVLSWSPQNYLLQDSVVYFWRVANDSIQYDTANYHWQQSSFIYIFGKTGWAQSHFHQFKSDNYENVRYDTLGRNFEFVYNNKALRANTIGFPDGSQTQYNEIGYWLNDVIQEYNGCQVYPSVMVAVIDSISLTPWNTCEYNFGQANRFILASGSVCGPNATGSIPGCNRTRPENYFIFHIQTAAEMDSLQNMINQVPTGNYILMYSWYTYPYSVANPALFSTINSLGFNTGLLQDSMPFIYFVRKDFPGTNSEAHGNTPSATITLNTLLNSHWNLGNINSELIGPARRWESLHWNQRPYETQPLHDIIYLNIYGLNATTNVWDTLMMDGVQYNTGKDTTLNWISATTYPYIRLQSYFQDDSLRTPAQMKYWRVYYDEVPECAVNPNRAFSFHGNPVQEGDTIRLSCAIENISNLPMDSLGVSFFIYDGNHVRHDIKIVKLDSLRTNQSLTASVVVDSTFGLAGENSLWMEANPYQLYHQPEKYHFNNLVEVKFNIDRDHTNPILDVTFDGVHILNNDIVSGKPQIAILLHDENKFLALNDTSKFRVFLTPPNSNVSQQIIFSVPAFGQAMRFTPASLPKNSCRIDWNPILTEDGIYTLEVEATDRSNNESGRFNYKISFEVINRSTITEVLNYPNPFSTSTRFVFTLTGSEIPTGMKVQIMTITGKIVREIMQNELGNIHIGRNITDYAWDGRDEYGDQLANGLYLYRVVTQLNGQNIEHRETDIDKFFKKGWGKMYLMR